MVSMRLQLGNPISQLSHLEKLAIVLHLHGTNPEDIGDQSTKAT